MARTVVVTGMGAITPVGLNVGEFWDSVKQSKIGFGPITSFDTTGYKCHIAAEVKGFDAKNYMDFKSAKRMERFSQFAIAAAKEAIEDAGLDMEKEDPYRVGCSIGSGIGGLEAIEREHKKLLQKGPARVNPLLVPLMISNMAAGNVSIAFGLKGKSLNAVTACATGTNCIGEAMRTIQYGDADVMVAGGCESSITPIGIAGFTTLTALSTVDDPARCSLPFDKDRSGFVMGEGAGVVILEELEHAKKRGAHIYAKLAGYGCASDAYHITSPDREGAGAAKSMEYAIADAGLKPEDITYVNAHGTATHHNDLFETKAIRLAFGSHAEKLRINSTKSVIGHLLGAAGAVEFIVCVKAIEESFIHATAGYTTPDEELGLNYCKEPYEEEVLHALTDSLGFGGHNASLVVSKYDL